VRRDQREVIAANGRVRSYDIGGQDGTVAIARAVAETILTGEVDPD
jgi:hypothetical protein